MKYIIYFFIVFLVIACQSIGSEEEKKELFYSSLESYISVSFKENDVVALSDTLISINWENMRMDYLEEFELRRNDITNIRNNMDSDYIVHKWPDTLLQSSFIKENRSIVDTFEYVVDSGKDTILSLKVNLWDLTLSKPYFFDHSSKVIIGFYRNRPFSIGDDYNRVYHIFSYLEDGNWEKTHTIPHNKLFFD